MILIAGTTIMLLPNVLSFQKPPIPSGNSRKFRPKTIGLNLHFSCLPSNLHKFLHPESLLMVNLTHSNFAMDSHLAEEQSESEFDSDEEAEIAHNAEK